MSDPARPFPMPLKKPATGTFKLKSAMRFRLFPGAGAAASARNMPALNLDYARKFRNLKYLNLSNNNIDDKGLELVSRMFEHCIDLKRIDVSHNKIAAKD